MKVCTLGIIEVIARIHDGQFKDGALWELHRLLHDQPTLSDSGFECVHALYFKEEQANRQPNNSGAREQSSRRSRAGAGATSRCR